MDVPPWKLCTWNLEDNTLFCPNTRPPTLALWSSRKMSPLHPNLRNSTKRQPRPFALENREDFNTRKKWNWHFPGNTYWAIIYFLRLRGIDLGSLEKYAPLFCAASLVEITWILRGTKRVACHGKHAHPSAVVQREKSKTDVFWCSSDRGAAAPSAGRLLSSWLLQVPLCFQTRPHWNFKNEL